jgi:serine/threonine-protein kinase HipA
MKKIEVLFCGWGQRWRLGTLADNGTDLLFEYSPEALSRGIEFSRLHLPLRSQAFGGFAAHQGSLPGLVADALPDGWGLLLMDKLFLKSGRDPSSLSPLDRLAFIGDRAMGALAFQPSDDLALDDADMSLLELAEAARQVEQGRDSKALRALALVGGAPHGARPKVLVQLDLPSRAISTRADAPGEPWLLKFPARGEHAEVCGVEYAYSIMARACGIEMPPTVHFRNDARLAAFGVQRFDRERGKRVPVHSFAGALNADFRLPSLDYRDVLRATRFFTGDEQEVRKAFLRCVFNLVFNNRDDHAKNFALRMNERMEWKLAPAYDLSFNAGPRGQHQTAVMGEGLLPGRQQLLALAKHCDVPMPLVSKSMDQVGKASEQLPAALDAVGVRKATQKMIVDAVQANARRCSVA